MKLRGNKEDYGWLEARRDLEEGVHPAVVAARLGEPEEYIRDTADAQGWPIAWENDAQPGMGALDPDWLDS